MAFSKSIQKAQLPISCNLCETEAKIKWKCLNCDLLMCNQCKEKIHPKFKFAKDHKIVATKEVGLHSQELDFSNIKCQKHSGQTCVMYCKTCQRLVCTRCIAKIHNGHELVEISEGYEAHVGKLKESQKQVLVNIDELTKAETKIQLLRAAESTKYQDVKNHIKAHVAEAKKALDQYEERLMKELNQKWGEIQKSMDQEEDRVSTMMNNMKVQNNLTEEIINSKDAEKVFERSAKLEKSLRKPLEVPELKFDSVPRFLPGEITQYNIGSLQDASTDIAIKINHQFTTDIPSVRHLSANPDGSLWISDVEIVQKVKPERNKLKVVNSNDIRSFGMAVAPSNDLLIASGPVLKQISGRTGEVTDSIYSVAPLHPTAVHVTKNQQVLVGAKNPGQDFPVRVIIMNKNGVHHTTFEHDGNNQALFTFVWYINCSSKGTIFVVDWFQQGLDRGRVVVLGQDGHILNIYNGHPELNTEVQPFQPLSLASTPSDNVIVSNQNNHYLYILNSVGNPITYYNTIDIGIGLPYSMSFTTSGKLYIGCDVQKGSTDKAKVYEVDISGV